MLCFSILQQHRNFLKGRFFFICVCKSTEFKQKNSKKCSEKRQGWVNRSPKNDDTRRKKNKYQKSETSIEYRNEMSYHRLINDNNDKRMTNFPA